jgi:hypothetical protein
MLHRLAELDEVVRGGYDAFEFKHAPDRFMVAELGLYFDILDRSIATPRRARSAKRRWRWSAICSIGS